MHMSDWEEKLNVFLQFTGRKVLKNAGSVSKVTADSLARKQYDLFEEHRRKTEDHESIEELPILPERRN